MAVGWVIRNALSRRVSARLQHIENHIHNIMGTQAQVAAGILELKVQLGKIGTEVTGKLTALEEAILAQGNASPEVELALAELKTAVQAVDNLIPDAPVEPPTEPSAPTEG